LNRPYHAEGRKKPPVAAPCNAPRQILVPVRVLTLSLSQGVARMFSTAHNVAGRIYPACAPAHSLFLRGMAGFFIFEKIFLKKY
jgi:hypothetical protein